MLQRITHCDNGLVWWNITFLFFVTMLPFSTHVVGAFDGQRLAVEIYCVNLVLIAALLLAQWRHVNRRGLVDPQQIAGRRLVSLRLSVVLTCYVAAAIFGWFDPKVYYIPFLAIPVVMTLVKRMAFTGAES